MTQALKEAMKGFEDDGKWTRYSTLLPTRVQNVHGLGLALDEDTHVVELALKEMGVRYKVETFPGHLDRHHCTRRVVYAFTEDLRKAGL